MGARDLLDDLRGSGFSVTAEGEKLVVSPWSKLTDDMLDALRKAKPDLMALLAGPATVSRTCTDCQHLLQHGTCGEPVAAGLLADEFGIVWPLAGHATSCGAFMPKPAPLPAGRPYRLSAAEADRYHAGAWYDGGTGRFVARLSLFLRRGVAAEDSNDLAERLVLRDRDGDDRRACVECRNLTGRVSTGLRCKAARAAGVAPELPAALVMQQQRCPAFQSERQFDGDEDEQDHRHRAGDRHRQ